MKLNQLTGLILLTLTPFLLSVRSQAPGPAVRAAYLNGHAAGFQPPSPYHTPMVSSIQTIEQEIAAQADSRPIVNHAGGCLYKTGNIALSAANMVKE